MTEDGSLPDEERLSDLESQPDDDRGAWNRLWGWSKEHSKPLLFLGLGVTAVAVGVRGRETRRTAAALESAAVAAKVAAQAAVEAAAAASERVYQEFQALGRDYNMAAMDQTVGQAIRRHQRWSSEELAVLRDTGKTALEKALELGRTYNGVMAKAIKEGASSKAP